MAWEQVLPFKLNKMGTTPGLCLQNTRLAFGAPSKYYDAKDAMLANKNAGTLHDISTLPKNVAVPVFVDTSSPYEHVEVADHGVFYSDGKRVSNPTRQKFFGWGETLNGARIVKYVADPAPAPQPAPFTGLKVGDKVILKNWVDYNGTPLRKTRDYYYIGDLNGNRAVLRADSVNGPVYCAANTANLSKVGASQPTPAPLKVGDKVTLKNWLDFAGTRLAKTRDYYYISQIAGNRAVLRADNPTSGPIYAAVNLANLTRV